MPFMGQSVQKFHKTGAWEENRTPDLPNECETGSEMMGGYRKAIGRVSGSLGVEGEQPESGGSRVAGQFVGQNRFVPKTDDPAI